MHDLHVLEFVISGKGSETFGTRGDQGVDAGFVDLPLVVRLEGTNVEAGKDIINNSGLDVIAADNLSDGAEKIVKAVKG